MSPMAQEHRPTAVLAGSEQLAVPLVLATPATLEVSLVLATHRIHQLREVSLVRATPAPGSTQHRP